MAEQQEIQRPQFTKPRTMAIQSMAFQTERPYGLRLCLAAMDTSCSSLASMKRTTRMKSTSRGTLALNLG